MTIPTQYLPVMPYLILNNAKAFAEFAKKVFDATEQMMVPTIDGNIMHGELRIGEAVIMYANAHEQWTEKTAGMFMYVNNVDETYRRALDNGAQNLMQPVKQDYGYTAGFNDPFGNQWWIVEGEA